MTEPIRLFVSSSPELAPEREALGQAVAELPVSVRWEIKHTPRPGEGVDEALDFLEGCDLFLVVLGADFAAPTTFQRRHSDGAPMGLEWRTALSGGKRALAYRKRVLYSPSARGLLGEWDVAWTVFETPQELKAHATQALARVLLDRGEEFGLHLEDVEGLVGLVEDEEERGVEEPDRRRGAGRGGVILGRGPSPIAGAAGAPSARGGEGAEPSP